MVGLFRRHGLPLLLAGVSCFAGAAPATPSDARGWLEAMRTAALQRSYQGTMVVTAGGVASGSRITHYCVGSDSVERVESLDGRMQRVYRHNGLTHTVWPHDGVVVVERRDAALPPSRALGAPSDPGALDRYELMLEGTARVAGRDAQVLLLQPRDEWRYPQRLWADRSSGLLLRADVVGPARTVLESAAFTDVQIDIRAQPARILAEMKSPSRDGLRVVEPALEPTRLDDEGWQITQPVPGFRPVGCLRRSLGERAGSDARHVVQAVFSDGLTHVSLFIEPYDAARHRHTLQGQIGATGTLTERRGAYWITAVGDVPMGTLARFVQALQRRP
ncbi:MAG: MucB/RseB C-terminal domain-containing protein [Rubrivivax sp.]|jgi:sigma-E factor negative regulatory protein RseB|nr:MucB/RseB C-terminal domain-containing protein [Rubrivivax sp.]